MSASQLVLRLYNRMATAPVIGPIVRLPVRTVRALKRSAATSPRAIEANRAADEHGRLEIMMLGAAVEQLSQDVAALRRRLDADKGTKVATKQPVRPQAKATTRSRTRK